MIKLSLAIGLLEAAVCIIDKVLTEKENKITTFELGKIILYLKRVYSENKP
jgi:hypothetical protein